MPKKLRRRKLQMLDARPSCECKQITLYCRAETDKGMFSTGDATL